MEPAAHIDYKELISQVLKKQLVILGPTITLLKARKVSGLTIHDDGTVTQITGSPEQIIDNLITEFSELSEPIVKKTMAPLLGIKQSGELGKNLDSLPEQHEPIKTVDLTQAKANGHFEINGILQGDDSHSN